MFQNHDNHTSGACGPAMLRKLRKAQNSMLAISLILLSGCAAVLEQQANTASIVFPYQWVGNIDKVGFKEPSGICFHSQRGTLFIVGDGGHVYEIETSGKLVKQMRVRHADFEGITHVPTSGLLYIAVERTESIIELNPETFEILREFSIPRSFKGKTLLAPSSEGIEAITFVPDDNHPEGGTFYVANQSFTLDNSEDISGIFEVELPLNSKAEKLTQAKLLRYFMPGVIDLSGLYYNQATEQLYAISDATNTIFVFDRSGTLISARSFPGDNQEGITVDNNGFMYIAQDSGGVIKISLKN